MARISASIPEELKDDLYRAADERNQAISHIIVEALRHHLASPAPDLPNLDVEPIRRDLRELKQELIELKLQLRSRRPPKSVRYF